MTADWARLPYELLGTHRRRASSTRCAASTASSTTSRRSRPPRSSGSEHPFAVRRAALGPAARRVLPCACARLGHPDRAAGRVARRPALRRGPHRLRRRLPGTAARRPRGQGGDRPDVRNEHLPFAGKRAPAPGGDRGGRAGAGGHARLRGPPGPPASVGQRHVVRRALGGQSPHRLGRARADDRCLPRRPAGRGRKVPLQGAGSRVDPDDIAPGFWSSGWWPRPRASPSRPSWRGG